LSEHDPLGLTGSGRKLYLSKFAPVGNSPDLSRILSLPKRLPPEKGSARSEALIEMMTARWSRGERECACGTIDPKIAAGKRSCIKRFNHAQAWILYELGITGGLIAHAPVGSGKSFCDIQATLALAPLGVKRTVLLIPPNLIEQIEHDYLLVREHFQVPAFYIHGIEKRYDVEGAPICHVIPYSRLSQPTASSWLRDLRPDAVIADECFTGETLIETNLGPLPIQDIVDSGKATHVRSFNFIAGEQTWRRIVARGRKLTTKQLVKVFHEKGTFVCTYDHKIWVEGRGYVKAGETVSTDRLRMCDLRTDFQTYIATEIPILLQQMRLSSSFTKNTRSVGGTTRGSSISDLRVQRVPYKFFCTGIRESSFLRSELCEQCQAYFSRMPSMQKQLLSKEKKANLLQRFLQPKNAKESPREKGLSYYKNMPELSEAIQDKIQREVYPAILHPFLWRESYVNRDQSALAFRTTADTPIGVQREPGSAKSLTGKNERSDLFVSGRKRQTNETTNIAMSGFRAPAGVYGVCGENRKCKEAFPECSSLLQGGSRDSGSETSNRSGRKLAQDQEMEVSRSSENRDLEFSRVVCVEVLERGSNSGDIEGSLGSYVYDLTVETDHNYYANGILVSNCDRLRDPAGAATSRVLRLYNEFGDTKFCGWTGSLTDSSLEDYAHLAALALRLQSPLPLDPAVVSEWGRALDESDNPAPPGELGQLCDEDLDPNDLDQIREGFRRRLSQTMGFVISSEASVSVGLTVTERIAPALPPIIQEALDKVRTCWVRPDTLVGSEYDEELVDAMQVAKVARELASGIFYRWRFDPINGVSQRKADIDEWLAARKDWGRELRNRLQSREEWLDSPHLCEHAAMRFWGDRPKRDDRPEWDAATWCRWREIKGKVKPTTEACRVSDYLVVDAARWGVENLGIIWYGMVDFGKWVSEVSGLPLHGGGPDAGKRISKEIGNRSIIASIASHGRGRDGLQALFCDQLITQFPSSASRVEQLMGRAHRQGQQRDVNTWYYAHTDEMRASFETACGRARYVNGTLGANQKILSGLR
jgi:hypothetical protein